MRNGSENSDPEEKIVVSNIGILVFFIEYMGFLGCGLVEKMVWTMSRSLEE